MDYRRFLNKTDEQVLPYLGGLFVDIFTDKVSKDLVLVLQALVILFVAAESMFGKFAGKVGLLGKSKV